MVNTVRDLNANSVKEGAGNITAYSIDAGFHVFVFTLKQNVQLVKSAIEAN